LIHAYHRLLERQPRHWDLVLAGAEGWESSALRQLVAELKLTKRVHFPGYIADEALPALYYGARLFCFPSLFEGFGLPVLEAQAHGVPVMTANNSALPEIAGDAALLVDPTDVDAIADAMLQLSQDEALRQRLITAGYENVKRFSWEKAAQETLAVLLRAARGRK
jgi:glycosyltransferase involved in cell wall biosynthesis